MKRIKRLAAVMMAAIMALAMSITAFATEALGASASPVTHTYEIYQIFTGDYAGGVLSNIKWGANGTGTEGEKVADDVLEALEAVEGAASDTEKLAVINQYADLDNSTPVRTGNDTSYTGLTPGYYLVKDKDGSQDGANEAYTLYVAQVVDDDLTFTPKSDVPETDKKIVEGNDKVSTNEASIGDEVNYEITGTMPSNIADYKTYYYMFTDTLSKGLTYKKDSIKVTVNGVDVTDYFYKGVGIYNETAGTSIRVGILDLKALSLLTDPAVGDITATTEVVLTYTATLNENAVIAGNGNPNDVKLGYSNDPNNSGNGATTPPPGNPEEPKPDHPVGETPVVKVVTYTTELTILKTDEADNFLPGVEFTLTGDSVNIVLVTEETFVEAADGEYWKLKDGTFTKTEPTVADDETDNTADYDSVDTKYKKTVAVVQKGNGKEETNVVGTVSEDGKVIFSGLGVGKYTITETKTLPGYNTIDPIEFTVSFDPDTKEFSADNNISLKENNTLETTIVNKQGSLLPSTGGIGTTIFYIVGAILVIGAGVILVAKKRMGREV